MPIASSSASYKDKKQEPITGYYGGQYTANYSTTGEKVALNITGKRGAITFFNVQQVVPAAVSGAIYLVVDGVVAVTMTINTAYTSLLVDIEKAFPNGIYFEESLKFYANCTASGGASDYLNYKVVTHV